MANTDLFNNFLNPSNDYINPDLAPCAGDSDSNFFEFLPNQQVGITNGNSIISSLSLNDIAEEISGWVTQSKILQSGEITFIQGLTKGITTSSRYFPWYGSVSYTGDDHQYYLQLDISINYYKNFRYYQTAISVEGDYVNGITIENALDMKLDELGISVTSSYDPSGLTFTGTQAGYWFDVTAVEAILYPDTSAYTESLIEDDDAYLPAYKYPNTAMLGYVLKVIYPTSSTINDYDKYVEVNHVPDYLTYYEASTGDTNCYVKYTKAVDVGQSGVSCDPDTISAADYLDKVETNNLWEKVGPLKIWVSVEDPGTSNVENLITGFYVFNPQSFSVKIEYMVIL